MSEEQTNESQLPPQPLNKTRLIISIICIALGLYVYHQAIKLSIIKDFSNLWTQSFGIKSDDQIGSTGISLAICLLGAGGIGLFTYLKTWGAGPIISGILCTIGVLLSLDVEMFQALYIFNSVSGIFALIFFISQKQEYLTKIQSICKNICKP